MKFSKSIIVPLCVFLCLSLSVSSCKKDDGVDDIKVENNNDNSGLVNAAFEISGAAEGSKDGMATFFFTQATDTPIMISIDDGNQGTRTFSLSIYFKSQSNNLPEPGEYKIGDEKDPEADFYLIYIDYGDSNTGYGSSSSGNIIIEESSSSKIKGTFSFKAEAINGSGKSIDVKGGAFEALGLN